MAETATQPNSLANCVKMCRILPPFQPGIASQCTFGGHDCCWSFSKAASRTAGLIRTIRRVDDFEAIAGRWINVLTRRQACRDIPSIRCSS